MFGGNNKLMLYINHEYTDPYFNHAVEEYFLKNFNDECFILWQNIPSILVGKNQNTFAEINLDYVKEHDIPVVRRLSGGGTIFGDLGNVYFTFISNNSDDTFADFKRFTIPVLNALNKLSINAEFSGRNDLTIDGKKFSGNAQYKYKNRVLHHGSLLFSSNMTDLTAALKVRPLKFQDKSVKSVASRVTNISDHLKMPMDVLNFKDFLMDTIIESLHEGVRYELTENDLYHINKISKEKFSTWEWNYGSSPKYSFVSEKKFLGGTVEVNLNVNKGIIKDIKIFGDFFGEKEIKDIETALIGIKHSEECIISVLSNFNFENYMTNITAENLIEVMF